MKMVMHMLVSSSLEFHHWYQAYLKFVSAGMRYIAYLILI